MTKQRPPITFSRALTRIAAVIGWDVCAQVLGKSESWVRKLSDPDAERHINLRDARRLDTAFQREGGEGAPLHECYALQLELSTGVRSFCSAEMLNAVGSVARETGEAVSAALTAIEQGTPKARRDAIREVEEGIASLTSMLGKLGAAEAFGGEENEPNSRG